MATQKTSIFRKDKRASGETYPPTPIRAEAKPKYPPEPLNADDRWPRIVGVQYMEPNPLAPDDRTKDIPRFSWAIYGTDADGAESLAMQTLVEISLYARQERAKMMLAAGERIREMQAMAAEVADP